MRSGVQDRAAKPKAAPEHSETRPRPRVRSVARWSRAGAATLAELALCGKASILIPYPYATNNHQEMNGREFVEEGAAIMITSSKLSGTRLAAEIINLESRPDQINEMEKQAKNLSTPRASERIANECYKLATQET